MAPSWRLRLNVVRSEAFFGGAKQEELCCSKEVLLPSCRIFCRTSKSIAVVTIGVVASDGAVVGAEVATNSLEFAGPPRRARVVGKNVAARRKSVFAIAVCFIL